MPGGPIITYFGIAETSGVPQPPDGMDGSGRLVFVRPQPRNFLLVVEARRNTNNINVGTIVFDPVGRPDLQIQSNRALGNGSFDICDNRPGFLGGVPGINPPSYDPDSLFVTDTINDFACRFVPHTESADACTFSVSAGTERFVSGSTMTQFCYEPAVGSEIAFPEGVDTILTVRVRNIAGGLGDPAQIVVRVLP